MQGISFLVPSSYFCRLVPLRLNSVQVVELLLVEGLCFQADYCCLDQLLLLPDQQTCAACSATYVLLGYSLNCV